jgi:hypothetical protein
MDSSRGSKRYIVYWGKSGHDGLTHHPLAFHCLDAAAVAWTCLEADHILRRRMARLTGWPEPAIVPLLAFLAGIHDLGKFSPGFQALVPELCLRLHGRAFHRQGHRHPCLSALAAWEIVFPYSGGGWVGSGSRTWAETSTTGGTAFTICNRPGPFIMASPAGRTSYPWMAAFPAPIGRS